MAKPWKLQAVQSPKDRLWYVRLSGGNGEVILKSRGSARLAQATALCGGVRAAQVAVLPDCEVSDRTLWVLEPATTAGGFYNRLSHRGKELMRGGTYARLDAAKRTCQKARDALVVTLEPLAAAAPKKT